MAKNRSEIVAEIAEKADTTQAQVNGVLDALFEVLETSVAQGEKVTIPGWFSVERTVRKARTGRNPQTGEVGVFYTASISQPPLLFSNEITASLNVVYVFVTVHDNLELADNFTVLIRALSRGMLRPSTTEGSSRA